MISKWTSQKYPSVLCRSVSTADCCPSLPPRQALYPSKPCQRSRSPNPLWLSRAPLSRATFYRNLKKKNRSRKSHPRRFLMKLMPIEISVLIITRRTSYPRSSMTPTSTTSASFWTSSSPEWNSMPLRPSSGWRLSNRSKLGTAVGSTFQIRGRCPKTCMVTTPARMKQAKRRTSLPKTLRRRRVYSLSKFSPRKRTAENSIRRAWVEVAQ